MTNELVVNPLQNERFYNIFIIFSCLSAVVNPLQNERFYNNVRLYPVLTTLLILSKTRDFTTFHLEFLLRV